jgi:hypothetical protein
LRFADRQKKSTRHCEERSPEGASDEAICKYWLPLEYLGLRIASPAIKQRDRNDRKEKKECIVTMHEATNYFNAS